MSEWVTTIISAISSFFTTLYTVNTDESAVATLAGNPILACVLIPVVGGIAAFCTRLAKKRKS